MGGNEADAGVSMGRAKDITIMALDRAIRHAGDGGSVYDERGLLFL